MDITGRNAAERFVICIENQGYPASLEKRKVYQIRRFRTPMLRSRTSSG
jgi:hypothetical protein